MVLVREQQRWTASSSYNERHALKECGFWWSPEDKVWWTDKPEVVKKLQAKMPCDILDQREVCPVKLPDSYDGHPSCATDGPDDIPCPPDRAYHPFQRGGIAFARGRDGVLIADEMGLGKTIQAIGMMNDDPVQKALVICPASLKLNWEHELDHWLNYYRKVEVVGSVWNKNKHIYIINYDILKKHKAEIDAVEWDILVCDESQYLKNPDAIRTTMVLGGGKKNISAIKARRRVFLSGTPMENRPIELYPVIHSLCPDVFPSQTDYAFRYCAAYMGPWGLDTRGASNLEELQFKLRESCMIRRMKKDVLTDLPPKQYQDMIFSCEGKARKAVDEEMREYDRLKGNLKNLELSSDLSTVEGREEYKKAEAMMRSRLASARKKTTEHLLPMALDYVETSMENGKVIVFCYHKFVMQEVMKKFGKYAVAISGETPMKLRQNAVDKFQNDPDVKLFVGQIQAAGTGITLTASSHVIFLERDYRPGAMSQAEDRPHRMGQKNNVLITNCVLENSYDQEMLNTLKNKSTTIDKAMNV